MELCPVSQMDSFESCVIPFEGPNLRVSLPEGIMQPVKVALEKKIFSGAQGEIFAMTLPVGTEFLSVVLVGLGTRPLSNRQAFLALAPAFRKCRDAGVKRLSVWVDNVHLFEETTAFSMLCRLPMLVDYSFESCLTSSSKKHFERVNFITSAVNAAELLPKAQRCGEGTLLARDITNMPSCRMTPRQLAQKTRKIGKECGFDVRILHRDQIRHLGMGCFLAVADGASSTPPELIVMHWRGADGPRLALIGKGIMYDSGGYSIKSKTGMVRMYDDCGGAAAVIGAIRAAALNRLPVDVVGIVAACENKIGDDACVPGDVIMSMAGKTVEMLNSDAEGRLTLADAATYAIRAEKAKALIDIATLTGGASTAVGNCSSAVFANDERMFDMLKQAAEENAEKIWRLDLDQELHGAVETPRADIKNSAPDGSVKAGTIAAALFIQSFVEEKPWLHIDMAPVGFVNNAQSWCDAGATGYGAALLYGFMEHFAADPCAICPSCVSAEDT